jgi:hypothetical protein
VKEPHRIWPHSLCRTIDKRFNLRHSNCTPDSTGTTTVLKECEGEKLAHTRTHTDKGAGGGRERERGQREGRREGEHGGKERAIRTSME